MLDNKQLQLKSAYGKVKRAEREAITTWTNVLYPDKDAVALERHWQEQKKRKFAKECWSKRNKLAPSGLTWEEVFYKLHRTTLVDYASNLSRKKNNF